MNYQNILFRAEGGVGYLTLNRPEKRNALSTQVLQEITILLKDVASKKDVRVVIIKGAGKIFSGGHDLKEVSAGGPQEVLALFKTCYEAMQAIRSMPQPVIAQVHGIATAAGCQLVAACDLALAAEDTLFGTPGAKLGLFCTTPAVFLSRNIGRKKALEMLFTGDMITAQEAMLHGLVNKVVPADKLEEATENMARTIAQNCSSAIAVGKRAFYRQLNMEDFMALNYASEVIALNTTTEDAQEGIKAFLEKRKPNWK